MTRVLGFVLVTFLVSLISPAAAVALPPAGCLSAPLPTTVGSPTYTFTIIWSQTDQARLDLWRQPCANNPAQAAILVRITPITVEPFVCSVNFDIIQDGIQFDARISPSPTGSTSFCNDLFVASTFLLTESGGSAILNPLNAFTLIHSGIVSPAQQLQVPAAGGPVQPSAPTLAIVATGCTTCHSGQVVGYRLGFTNNGPATSAELKGGARFPDGSSLPLLNQVSTIPPGASTLTFVSLQTLPAGLPTLDLVIEAAILDPIFGVTISRQTTTLHLLP